MNELARLSEVVASLGRLHRPYRGRFAATTCPALSSPFVEFAVGLATKEWLCSLKADHIQRVGRLSNVLSVRFLIPPPSPLCRLFTRILPFLQDHLGHSLYRGQCTYLCVTGLLYTTVAASSTVSASPPSFFLSYLQ